MSDAREMLIEDICMYLGAKNINIQDIKNELYIVVNNYAVEKETTEIVEYEGDVNEILIKRFLASKTIQGCTQRTIRFYAAELKRFNAFVNKPFTQVTADDIRYLTAKKLTIDKVSKTTVGNTQRCLSSFFAWMEKEEITEKKHNAQSGKDEEREKEEKSIHRDRHRKNKGWMQDRKGQVSCRSAPFHMV